MTFPTKREKALKARVAELEAAAPILSTAATALLKLVLTETFDAQHRTFTVAQNIDCIYEQWKTALPGEQGWPEFDAARQELFTVMGLPYYPYPMQEQ